MNRREFVEYSGLATITFLTGCKPQATQRKRGIPRAPTNTLPIEGGLEPYKIPGYEINEIEINGVNYALLPLGPSKTAQVEIKEENITLERQTIADVMLVPDNNRTETTITDKAIISPHNEVYFLANIGIDQNTPSINTTDNLEKSRIIYSRKRLEEKLTKTNGLVSREIEERTENLKAYKFGGEEYVSLPYKTAMPNTLSQVFIKKQAQHYVERKRNSSGVEVELSLEGHNFIPIRGKEVDIPRPPQQETPELEAIEIKSPINQ